MPDRLSAVGGDFFADESGIPCGADVYMLKWILHDWSDSRCLRILQSIRKAATSQRLPGSDISSPSRVLIVEQFSSERALHASSDLDMWVIYGGRERSVS